MRNVRPSWVRVSKDNHDNGPTSFWKGTGPRGRSGTLSVEILARINGEAVPVFAIDCIGAANGETTLLRILDLRTGKAVFEERVTQ
jgi:hypothetical protein